MPIIFVNVLNLRNSLDINVNNIIFIWHIWIDHDHMAEGELDIPEARYSNDPDAKKFSVLPKYNSDINMYVLYSIIVLL